MDLRNKKVWKKILIVGIIFSVFAFLFGNKNFRAFIALKKDIKRIEKKTEDLKKENEKLKDELKEAKENPQYIENLARKELGMIKPGETIYKFIQSEKNQRK